MKRLTRETRIVEQQVWCDACRVRVAPYEDFVTHNQRKFHRQCFQKSTVKTGGTPGLVAATLDTATA